jgi:hypothetical protein
MMIVMNKKSTCMTSSLCFLFLILLSKPLKIIILIDELLNQRNLEKGNLPRLMRLLMTT